MYSRILIAFDGSELSINAVEKAKELSRLNEEAVIHLVHAWSVPAQIAYNNNIYEQMVSAYKQEAEATIKKGEELLQGIGRPVKSALLEGNPATKIVEYAENEKVDLIIIGSRGLGNVKRLFLGSVSYNVVQRASCPVLVIK